jgi:CRP/FNR family transcriptional regulator, cyclic AMP receptor protein
MPHTDEPDVKRSLQNVQIFRDLPDELRRLIERDCTWRRFAPRQFIVDYLDESHDVFFLTSGAARVVIYSPMGRPVAFRDLGSGEIFGEFAALDGRPRSASVEAVAESLVARMTDRDFQNMLRSHGSVGLALAKHLVVQLRLLSDRVYEYSTLSVSNRLHAELLRLAREASGLDRQVCISPAPTHAFLASRIATHREAVSREMSRLARLGLLERRGPDLCITDVVRLERMVSEATGTPALR